MKKIVVLLFVLSLFLVPKNVYASTQCGGTAVRVTTTQSQLMAKFGAVWDGWWNSYVKYTAPSTRACHIRMTFSLASSGTIEFQNTSGVPNMIPSTGCVFLTDHKNIQCDHVVNPSNQVFYTLRFVSTVAPAPSTLSWSAAELSIEGDAYFIIGSGSSTVQ